MKKTLIVMAVMAVAGSAMACSGSSCTVVSNPGAMSLTTNAGATASTSAGASSAGNGSAVSINRANATGSASGASLATAGNVGPLSVGASNVSGRAATSGNVYSSLITSGNATANGTAIAEACADVVAGASFGITGLNPVSGSASGAAHAGTTYKVTNSAGPGTGSIVAAISGNTTSEFMAGDDARRVGFLVNTVNSVAGASSISSESREPVFVWSGNVAGTAGTTGTAGTASALANAKAGNLCTPTSCSNSRD